MKITRREGGGETGCVVVVGDVWTVLVVMVFVLIDWLAIGSSRLYTVFVLVLIDK